MKLRKSSFFYSLISIFFLSLFLASCSQSGTARVVIDLGLQNQASKNQTPRVIDKVVNILTLARSANAAAPSNITSIVLTVTGPGMSDFTQTYPASTSTIDVNVPAGNSRLITVTANIDPSDPRAVLAYSGTATLDLKNGDTKSISLSMMASETKIVIPDPYHNRVVQIDDMNGTNWKTLSQTSANTPISVVNSSSISPQDIAFDAQGRIYVATKNSSTGGTDTVIFRIDSITGGAAAVTIISASPPSSMIIQAIAIDMKNAFLYYATTTQIYRSNLDGTGSTTLTGITALLTVTTPPVYISGINVDDNGMMYIAYNNSSSFFSYGINRVSKIDPLIGGSSAITFDCNTYFGNSNYAPTDAVVKSGNVYVSIASYATTAKQIVQLDSNLQFVNYFGTHYTAQNSTAAGEFYGPEHFIAILNRKLYIMDDGGLDTSLNSNNKLVSMDDINGTGWTTYDGSTGPGTFGFYYPC